MSLNRVQCRHPPMKKIPSHLWEEAVEMAGISMYVCGQVAEAVPATVLAVAPYKLKLSLPLFVSEY